MEIDYYLVSSARRTHRLRPGREYVIGREQGVEIQLHDTQASRRHAALRHDPQGFWVVADLGSRNGVYVNGERIPGSRALRDQDRIQVAGQVFSYQLVPPGCDVGLIGDQAPEISNQVTMPPGVSAAEMMSQGAAFSGSVGVDGLLELLQFLALTRKSGRLDLFAVGAPAGSVWIASGAPREALCGASRGLAAIQALVAASGLTFAFHAGGDAPPSHSITGSAEAVLMELARGLDEGRR